MKLAFHPGNDVPYVQDFAWHRGIPAGVVFDVEVNYGTVRLVGPGYGSQPYGAGALYLHGTAREVCLALKPPRPDDERNDGR